MATPASSHALLAEAVCFERRSFGSWQAPFCHGDPPHFEVTASMRPDPTSVNDLGEYTLIESLSWTSDWRPIVTKSTDSDGWVYGTHFSVFDEKESEEKSKSSHNITYTMKRKASSVPDGFACRRRRMQRTFGTRQAPNYSGYGLFAAAEQLTSVDYVACMREYAMYEHQQSSPFSEEWRTFAWLDSHKQQRGDKGLWEVSLPPPDAQGKWKWAESWQLQTTGLEDPYVGRTVRGGMAKEFKRTVLQQRKRRWVRMAVYEPKCNSNKEFFMLIHDLLSEMIWTAHLSCEHNMDNELKIAPDTNDPDFNFEDHTYDDEQRMDGLQQLVESIQSLTFDPVDQKTPYPVVQAKYAKQIETRDADAIFAEVTEKSFELLERTLHEIAFMPDGRPVSAARDKWIRNINEISSALSHVLLDPHISELFLVVQTLSSVLKAFCCDDASPIAVVWYLSTEQSDRASNPEPQVFLPSIASAINCLAWHLERADLDVLNEEDDDFVEPDERSTRSARYDSPRKSRSYRHMPRRDTVAVADILQIVNECIQLIETQWLASYHDGHPQILRVVLYGYTQLLSLRDELHHRPAKRQAIANRIRDAMTDSASAAFQLIVDECDALKDCAHPLNSRTPKLEISSKEAVASWEQFLVTVEQFILEDYHEYAPVFQDTGIFDDFPHMASLVVAEKLAAITTFHLARDPSSVADTYKYLLRGTSRVQSALDCGCHDVGLESVESLGRLFNFINAELDVRLCEWIDRSVWHLARVVKNAADAEDWSPVKPFDRKVHDYSVNRITWVRTITQSFGFIIREVKQFFQYINGMPPKAYAMSELFFARLLEVVWFLLDAIKDSLQYPGVLGEDKLKYEEKMKGLNRQSRASQSATFSDAIKMFTSAEDDEKDRNEEKFSYDGKSGGVDLSQRYQKLDESLFFDEIPFICVKFSTISYARKAIDQIEDTLLASIHAEEGPKHPLLRKKYQDHKKKLIEQSQKFAQNAKEAADFWMKETAKSIAFQWFNVQNGRYIDMELYRSDDVARSTATDTGLIGIIGEYLDICSQYLSGDDMDFLVETIATEYAALLVKILVDEAGHYFSREDSEFLVTDVTQSLDMFGEFGLVPAKGIEDVSHPFCHWKKILDMMAMDTVELTVRHGIQSSILVDNAHNTETDEFKGRAGETKLKEQAANDVVFKILARREHDPDAVDYCEHWLTTNNMSSGLHKKKMRMSRRQLAGLEGQLIIIVHSAKELPQMDTNGLADPYVKVTLRRPNGVKIQKGKKTPPMRKTLTPRWDEKLLFAVEPSYFDEYPELHVHFRVFDYDMLKSDEFIGDYKVKIRKFSEGMRRSWAYLRTNFDTDATSTNLGKLEVTVDCSSLWKK